MDKAKSAVNDFLHNNGHRDTTVHEKVAPAVTHETVNKEKHEDVQTAVDREVHQDHYHTSVQPVQDREVLPEQHSHKTAAVENREFSHGDSNQVKERYAQEASQFKNERHEGSTTHTSSNGPVVGGEHVHHHVHESIQPVVQKETIQPSVEHTTVPIHEVHHNEAKKHQTSALPAVSMADFKKQGGSLNGREERYDGFEGEPQSMTRNGTHGSHNSSNSGSNGISGHSDSNIQSTRKPSLGERLDPKTDADHDGKKGMMD